MFSVLLKAVKEKENILQGQRPYSYVLSSSRCKDQYAVSWIQKDGRIKNSVFEYDSKTKTWFYRNGTPHSFKSFNKLLSSMFHCAKEELHFYE